MVFILDILTNKQKKEQQKTLKHALTIIQIACFFYSTATKHVLLHHFL